MSSHWAAGEMQFGIPGAPPEEHAPGTRLYHLAPYGLGSGRCEGLVSYINRLARAHCVSPHKLIRHLFAEVDPGIAKLHRNSFYVFYIGTADGLGEYAERLSSAANLLTGHTDLALLTFLPWSDVLPVNGEGLISRYPRWCVPCLVEQLAETGETYHPLVWSLALYSHCVKHRCLLHDRCPHCGKRQAHAPKIPDGVLCCHCRESLLSSHADVLEEDFRLNKERVIEAAIARNGDLVNISTKEHFLRALQFIVEQSAQGNHAAFCRIMGWNEWALNGWLKNGQKITFPKLLEITMRFQINPVDLCIGAIELAHALLDASPTCSGEKLVHRAPKPQLTPAQRVSVQDQLLAILRSPDLPPSLTSIATRFSLTRAGLKYWFPELCAEASSRRRRLCSSQATLARDERSEIVYHAITDIRDSGRAPSRRSVDAAIRNFGLALARPEVFRSYRTALKTSNDLLDAQSCDRADRFSSLT